MKLREVYFRICMHAVYVSKQAANTADDFYDDGRRPLNNCTWTVSGRESFQKIRLTEAAYLIYIVVVWTVPFFT